MSTKVGENIGKEPIRLIWANLQPVHPHNFKRLCPVCEDGVLPVRSDPQTARLLSEDWCTYCGQPVIYTDIDAVDGIPRSLMHGSRRPGSGEPPAKGGVV